MWDAQVASLVPHYRVVRYDSRGHGDSEVPSGPYTIDDLGRDAVGVLDALHIERATVLQEAQPTVHVAQMHLAEVYTDG